MPPNGHALLSASASDRWLHCPPSARLCELYEYKGSDYAAEGTDAHTLCEYKLRKALGMEATDPTENLTWFNQEMDEWKMFGRLLRNEHRVRRKPRLVPALNPNASDPKTHL